MATGDQNYLAHGMDIPISDKELQQAITQQAAIMQKYTATSACTSTTSSTVSNSSSPVIFGGNIGGWGTYGDNITLNDVYNDQQYMKLYPYSYNPAPRQQIVTEVCKKESTIKFFRVNELAEITKSALRNKKFKEPLDELRIKVADWLGKLDCPAIA